MEIKTTEQDVQATMLKRIDYFPNTAVPCFMSVVDPKNKDIFEAFLGYRHSHRSQAAYVKIYKNNKPVEYLTAEITEDGIAIELIDENETPLNYRLDMPVSTEERLPLEISKTSKHPFAERLRSVRAGFPSLPNLDQFRAFTPSHIVLEAGNRIVLSMPYGGKVAFNPQYFFNVGGELPDDFLGCLFGPIGCAISVGIAIMLLSSDAW